MTEFKKGDKVVVLNNSISGSSLPKDSVTTITGIEMIEDEVILYYLEDIQDAKASPWAAINEDIKLLNVPLKGGE